MNAPMTGTLQFTSATADRSVEIINKLQSLGTGKSVGPNYYRDTGTLLARFTDYARGGDHIRLSAAEIETTIAYIDNRQNAVDAPVRKLLVEGRETLARWADYRPQAAAAPAARPRQRLA